MVHRELHIGSITTPQLGQVWAAMSARGLVAVEFGVGRGEFESTLQRQLRNIELRDASGARNPEEAAGEIAEYLDGRRRSFDIPIDWSVLSSDFQRLALRAVYAIPYGERRTYGQVAARIGYPRAPRAVGRANATNPMPIIIPCHRVLGSDGKLHGYGGCGGLITKQWLLDLECGRVRPGSARLVYEATPFESGEASHSASAQWREP